MMKYIISIIRRSFQKKEKTRTVESNVLQTTDHIASYSMYSFFNFLNKKRKEDKGLKNKTLSLIYGSKKTKIADSLIFSEQELPQNDDLGTVSDIVRFGMPMTYDFLASVSTSGLIKKILNVLSTEPFRNWISSDDVESLYKMTEAFPDVKKNVERASYYAHLYGKCFIWWKALPKEGVSGNDTEEEIRQKIEDLKNYYKNPLIHNQNYAGFEVISPNANDSVGIKIQYDLDRFSGGKKVVSYYSIGEFTEIHPSHVQVLSFDPQLNDNFLFEDNGTTTSLIQQIFPFIVYSQIVLSECVDAAVTRNNKTIEQSEKASELKENEIDKLMNEWRAMFPLATQDQILEKKYEFTSAIDEALATGILETFRKTSVIIGYDGTKITNQNGRIDDFKPILDGVYQLISANVNIPSSKLMGIQSSGLGNKDEGSQKFYLQYLGSIQNALTPILEKHFQLAAEKIGSKKIKISWLPMDESSAFDQSEIIINKINALNTISPYLKPVEIRETLRTDDDLKSIVAKKENDSEVDENAKKLQEKKESSVGNG
jgi:hypothetical protein